VTDRPDKKTTGPVRLSRAFGSTFRGFTAAWREEEAFRQECLLALVVIPLGLWLAETGVERALLAGPMLLILVVELLNSAIEAAVDRFGVERGCLRDRAEVGDDGAPEGDLRTGRGKKVGRRLLAEGQRLLPGPPAGSSASS